jgi:hypothetical protein
VIYGIYQMGPTQTKHSIFTDVTKYLNLNVSFTGSAPGQPIVGGQNMDPFGSLYNQLGSNYNSAASTYQTGGFAGLAAAGQAAGQAAYGNAGSLIQRTA